MPHFEQSDAAYVTYPPISDAYEKFDLELSFKPEATDGQTQYFQCFDILPHNIHNILYTGWQTQYSDALFISAKCVRIIRTSSLNMYYGSGTEDRIVSGQPVDAAATGGCVCTHQIAALF